MIEDDSYRSSSQFRLWSFTTTQLQERREETNSFAAGKVKAAFARAKSASVAPNGQDNGVSNKSDGIDTLTVEEEQRIVQWGCEKILEMKTALDPRPSSTIIATAIQYLRRFYLVNSPMTYHPKQLMVCALFLAMKAEHMYFGLTRFTAQLGNLTEDEVKAPEFLLMQALRFTLDVRHPMRGLEGGISELHLHASELDIFKDTKTSKSEIANRIDSAAHKARQLLVTAAQMTDAYFLYTPPQIYLATLYIVDKALTLSYLGYLFDRLGTSIPPIKQKLIDTISGCAEMIAAYKSPDDKTSRTELARIAKKLRKCQDPEKVDIVAVAQAKAADKRAGVVGAGGGDDGSDTDADAVASKKAKKRKLDAGKTVDSDGDVFGGDLKPKEKKV